jgi:Organic solvent tolerance protein OstA
MTGWWLLWLAVVVGGCLLPGAARAIEGPSKESPIVFEADLLTYDKERQIIEATGNVEARQEGQTLYADVLIYDQINDTITARGNVKLIQPDGEVAEADTFELTDDMKQGVADNLRAVFSDGSRVTGESGTRSGGTINTVQDGTYTPCFPCKDDPNAAPLWQVKSVKVTHDQTAKVIEFEHAWVEIGGVPVAYLPYFSRPDPTVHRKSGFLAPTFGYQSELGGIIRLPYFWAFAENQDVTITPWIASSNYPVLAGEYRGDFTHGSIRANGTITQDTEGETGGHIFGAARYDIDDNWRAGLDAQRTLYRQYLRKYGISGQRTLVSRLFGENFTQRNYFAANAYAFQNLDDTKQETIPFVAPMLDYNFSGEQDSLGGFPLVDLNGVVLTRRDGTDTRRLSARGRWDRPFIGPFGQLITVTAALWGDGYQVEDEQINGTNDFSGLTGRVFPTGAITWSLPLVADSGPIQQTFEPIAQFVAAPRYGNPNKLPDEDSQDFELQDTNIFSLNPSPGRDRVLTGSRVNYGFQWTGYAPNDANASVLFGQTYRFDDDNVFGNDTGYDGNFSDFVTAVRIEPRKYLGLSYRNRFDSHDLSPKTNEVGVGVGVPALNAGISYTQLAAQPSKNLVSRDEIAGTLNAKISHYWTAQVTTTRDIKENVQRSMGVQLSYEDECFLFTAGFTRENYDDVGLDAQNSFLFRIWLKTLGDFHTGFKVGPSTE